MASVLDLVKHYQHAIEKYPNDEQKVLKSIDKLFGLGVTVQHLQETGVGRTVNALRKEPGDVGQAARALVYKWKMMVAAEESDHEADQNNDTANCNGYGNGKDSDDNANQSRSRHNEISERSSKSDHKSQNQINGNTSGSKRKYHSSEEEDHSNKKSKHSSSSENYDQKHPVKVKQEQPESDEQHDTEDSHSSDSESEMSESSEDDRKVNQKIKIEPKENCKSPSIKHSSHNHGEHRNESSSLMKSSDCDKQSKSHKTESRHPSDKSSSMERSQSSHKHKSSTHKNSSSEKKYKSDHSIDKDKKKDDINSSSKHKSSSDKHSEKHSSQSEKLSSSSESHKSSSQKDNKSDKHKEKCDKNEKRESKSDKHSSQADKSDKEKHNSSSKSSSNKDTKKHKSRESSSSSKEKVSSSSKEKTKDSSSKKSGDSHKSENKSSSHESKSKSESKDTNKGNDRGSEKKSKNKSSSSSSHKSEKSSSSRESVPKTKPQINNSVDSDDGIDCGSGASFAEALGMVSPVKPKKKSISLKEMSSPNSFNNDLSPAALLAPSAKLAPLPALEISALPEISPNYKPRPPPRLMPHFTDDDAMNAVISSKNQRTKVYSGNKVIGKIPTLYELCVHVLQEHIDALEFTGGVPYEILKPIVDRATPQQLFVLEYHNPYLTEDTDHLWKAFCEKHFRNKKREEMEAWREMYMRCQEEQEDKLKSLTANIKMTQEAKKAPIKQTKMAYVDSVVKPPRNIARKQAQHGTAFASSASPAARVAALASAPNVLRGGGRPAAPASAPAPGAFKPKKAPLMAKALQFMRGRKR